MGVELDIFQLLSAWTWSEDFDLQKKFTELSDELRPFGFESVGDDTNLMLRCCAAIVKGNVDPATLITMNGSEVRDRFDEIENGIKGAIDFLRKNLHVESLLNLPYTALIIPLSVFFAVSSGREARFTDKQRRTIISWFWRSCFSRRFSAGVIRNLNNDITQIVQLRDIGASKLADNIRATVEPQFFSAEQFSIRTTNSKTFVLLLAGLRPRSFISGATISLAPVLQAYNRNEFHHLYPQAFLKYLGYETSEINVLANFAIISRQDNNALGGGSPSLYRGAMDVDAVPKILEGSACPASLFDDDYATFIGERSAKLADIARSLIS